MKNLTSAELSLQIAGQVDELFDNKGVFFIGVVCTDSSGTVATQIRRVPLNDRATGTKDKSGITYLAALLCAEDVFPGTPEWGELVETVRAFQSVNSTSFRG